MTKPFDPTRPVQLRDGRHARILCHDARVTRGECNIIALYDNGSGGEALHRFMADGKVSHGSQDDPFDLINVPEKHTRWVNVYASGGGVLHPSREEADDGAGLGGAGRIACIRIEFCEGDGL